MSDKDVDYLEQMNQEMKHAIEANDFDLYYEKNLNFHRVYLDLCENEKLIRIVNTLKKDFMIFPGVRASLKNGKNPRFKSMPGL